MEIHSKKVSDLQRGDVLILDDETRATVTSASRSGIFETPGDVAYEVCWRAESGEDERQLAPSRAEVRVAGGAK